MSMSTIALIIGDGTHIQRLSIDRPTVIQGLNKNDALTTRKDLVLLPSDPESAVSSSIPLWNRA